MSMDSWVHKYYKVEAGDPSLNTDEIAIEHSLRKWWGLRHANLKAHNLRVTQWKDIQDNVSKQILSISSETCALCYFCELDCRDCPITEVRGLPCDQEFVDEDTSPWSAWMRDSNPKPMIKTLIETLRRERGE